MTLMPFSLYYRHVEQIGDAAPQRESKASDPITDLVA